MLNKKFTFDDKKLMSEKIKELIRYVKKSRFTKI